MSSTKKNLTREEFKLTDKEIEKLCTAGAQAPSGGNIQPWQVVIYQKRILELRLDPERSNTFLDVGQLASFLALGAFYENVCIAADSLGLKYQSNKLPYKKVKEPFNLPVLILFMPRMDSASCRTQGRRSGRWLN